MCPLEKGVPRSFKIQVGKRDLRLVCSGGLLTLQRRRRGGGPPQPVRRGGLGGLLSSNALRRQGGGAARSRPRDLFSEGDGEFINNELGRTECLCAISTGKRGPPFLMVAGFMYEIPSLGRMARVFVAGIGYVGKIGCVAEQAGYNPTDTAVVVHYYDQLARATGIMPRLLEESEARRLWFAAIKAAEGHGPIFLIGCPPIDPAPMIAKAREIARTLGWDGPEPAPEPAPVPEPVPEPAPEPAEPPAVPDENVVVCPAEIGAVV